MTNTAPGIIMDDAAADDDDDELDAQCTELYNSLQ